MYGFELPVIFVFTKSIRGTLDRMNVHKVTSRVQCAGPGFSYSVRLEEVGTICVFLSSFTS